MFVTNNVWPTGCITIWYRWFDPIRFDTKVFLIPCKIWSWPFCSIHFYDPGHFAPSIFDPGSNFIPQLSNLVPMLIWYCQFDPTNLILSIWPHYYDTSANLIPSIWSRRFEPIIYLIPLLIWSCRFDPVDFLPLIWSHYLNLIIYRMLQRASVGFFRANTYSATENYIILRNG